jgi:hypothetical protein
VCRRRGVRQTVTGTVADLRAANVLPFDTLILLGNNPGLQRDEQHAPVMLATLAELTTPGAVIIGQNLNPYANASPLNVAYHQRNRERGRMQARSGCACATKTWLQPSSTISSRQSRSYRAWSRAPHGRSSRFGRRVAPTWCSYGALVNDRHGGATIVLSMTLANYAEPPTRSAVSPKSTCLAKSLHPAPV